MQFDERKMDMTRNYPEQLGDWVKQNKLAQRDKNLVAFLAVRDDVKAALDAGYAVKTVWANLQACKRTEIGYEVFLRYVNRMIRSPQANQGTAAKTPALPSPLENIEHKSTPKDATPAAKSMQPAVQAGFNFNPVPDIKELM